MVRPRRSATSRVFASLFLLIVAGVLGTAAIAYIGYDKYVAEGPLQKPKVFQVGKGLGAPEIAAALKQEGIISDDRVFSIAALVTGSRGRLKAGEYEFPAHASIRDVMNAIASGKVILYKVTIPEGWTTEMALDRVRENDVLTGNLTVIPGEGEIMPATYSFGRGKTRDELVTEMSQSQARLVQELWDSRPPNVPLKSAREALILASIVEKETGVPEERGQVAAVFLNRLKKNMRLQSDPTIIYGIVGGKGKLDRPLSKADVAAKTPYNTYEIDGLPPGPIANPGRDALEAVLNPAPGNALYFVADGSGGHAFADTLVEHNANVQKWRGVEKNRALIEAQEAAAEAAEAQQPSAPAATEPANVSASQPPPIQMPDINADIAMQPPDTPSAAEPMPFPAPDKSVATNSTSTGTGSPPAKAAEAKPASQTPAPAKDSSGDTRAAQPAKDHKPGEIIKVANRLVPIPLPKPKRP